MKIVREREKIGWLDATEVKGPEKPKTSMEEAVKMDDEVQKTVANLWSNYCHELADSERINKEVGLLKQTKRDAPTSMIAAVHLLYLRRNYEYEGYEVVIPQEA